MRGLSLLILLALSACAAPPVAKLSASSSEQFNTSSDSSKLNIESKAISIYLAPCASDVCGTVVIAPGASFRFVHPMVSVTDLQHKPRTSLMVDASDSEIDLSSDGNSQSSGWSLQAKTPRPGKRQNFIVHLAGATAGGLVLQLPDVELNGKQARLPAVTLTSH
ncbi:hypothetical protein GTP45_24315 [Pseudoduganella sp. FT55W]|uniref:DUF4232 domain-containing protein n=1 Tax=Duganella rivi TaxID=2666083 RepID=A0A7X4GVJ9_9BURK|nr:hypothetical protein [Duganella rivi]MYM69949.1 hypothetical protein [Duganella rivi]